MTTKRYFYDDALAACWMQKHFGMQFHDGTLEEALWPWDHVLDQDADEKADRFYVHPDSLHLLHQQDGDRDQDGFTFCRQTQAWWRECGMDNDGKLMSCAKLPEASVTFLRNGIVFHWPESDESISA